MQGRPPRAARLAHGRKELPPTSVARAGARARSCRKRKRADSRPERSWRWPSRLGDSSLGFQLIVKLVQTELAIDWLEAQTLGPNPNAPSRFGSLGRGQAERDGFLEHQAKRSPGSTDPPSHFIQKRIIDVNRRSHFRIVVSGAVTGPYGFQSAMDLGQERRGLKLKPDRARLPGGDSRFGKSSPPSHREIRQPICRRSSLAQRG